MSDLYNLICRHCGKHFKRQDHKDRHELSHGEAHFRCEEQSCGMLFHRRDVLKRHESVHRRDTSKRHRQARRGPVPKPFIASKHFEDINSSADDGIPGPSHDSFKMVQSDTSILPVSIVTAFPLASLEFCLLHFQHTHARRWPFIHHLAFREDVTFPEKTLAMAALGGCGIPEYRAETRRFFREALTIVNTREEDDMKLYGEPQNLSDPIFYSSHMVPLFQTKVLLLEYALWHADDDAKRWAFGATFELASATVPQFMAYLNNRTKGGPVWSDWVHEEQCVRVLWTFYCITQKASHLFPCAISTLRIQKDLRLPQSEILFNAVDEHTWARSRQELSANGSPLFSPTLKSAIQLVQCLTMTSNQALATLTPIARHIVLVCLLEMYNNAFRYLTSDFEDGLLEHTGYTPPTAILPYNNAVSNARSLWYTSPGSLLTASPYRGTDLQNGLLLDHLKVLLIRSNHSRSLRAVSQDLCTAASVAADILISIYESGMLDVMTRAPWLTDAASRLYVIGFARKMVMWAASLESLHVLRTDVSNDSDDENADDGNAQWVLYNRVKVFLIRYVEGSGHGEGAKSSELRHFKAEVVKAWCAVLHCPVERWCSPRYL